jgi:hypothetical protein
MFALMVDRGGVKPKGSYQRELLINMGCLLPFSESSMDMSSMEKQHKRKKVGWLIGLLCGCCLADLLFVLLIR